MNYYFFLDFPDNDYNSSLDIFNMPSNKKLCKDSLRDCFVNVFYSDGKKWIFHQLTRLKKNESIDHPWINKAMERAQKKVEARNFDIRKSLLKFDNVLNDQRQVIFNQRKEILTTEDILQFVNKMLDDENIVYFGGDWREKFVEGHPTEEGCENISEVLYDSFNR